MNTSRSEQLYKTACGFMPGGVNSPVRACKAVGTVPLFIDHAKGSRIWDEDGNEFIDYMLISSPPPMAFTIVFGVMPCSLL